MGINFTGLLFLMLLGLKISGVITWSWIWVLSPLWIPLAIVAFLCSVIGICIVWGKISDKGNGYAKKA